MPDIKATFDINFFSHGDISRVMPHIRQWVAEATTTERIPLGLSQMEWSQTVNGSFSEAKPRFHVRIDTFGYADRREAWSAFGCAEELKRRILALPEMADKADPNELMVMMNWLDPTGQHV